MKEEAKYTDLELDFDLARRFLQALQIRFDLLSNISTNSKCNLLFSRFVALIGDNVKLLSGCAGVLAGEGFKSESNFLILSFSVL
jgi:hypothetical protein